VGIDGHAVREVRRCREIDRLFPVAVKARIERAGGGQSRDCEVDIRSVARAAGEYNSVQRIDSRAKRRIGRTPERDRLLAVAIKPGIERAGRSESGYREVLSAAS